MHRNAHLRPSMNSELGLGLGLALGGTVRLSSRRCWCKRQSAAASLGDSHPPVDHRITRSNAVVSTMPFDKPWHAHDHQEAQLLQAGSMHARGHETQEGRRRPREAGNEATMT